MAKVVIIHLPFEGTYEGEIDDSGFRSGKGKITYFNGSIYEGEFLKNKRHGRGSFTWARGDRYVGAYRNDKKNGFGKFIWVSGNRYVGDFVNDRRCGLGHFIWPDGEAYEGLFENDTRKRGCYLYNTGDRYIGEFQGGMRHGTGSYYYRHGDQYHGQFVRGFRDGKGIILFANGNKYDGWWKSDKRNGMGVFSWASGNRYEGYFVQDMRTGYGIYYYSDGLRYEGMFSEGKKHGNGILFRQDGSLIHQVYNKGVMIRKRFVTPFSQESMSVSPLVKRMKMHDNILPSAHIVIKKHRGYAPSQTCEEAVLSNAEELKMVLIGTIMEGCKQLMSEAFQQKKALYRLSDDELLALALYAFDLGEIDLFNIYSTINKILRDNDPLVMKRWKGFLVYLMRALDKLPNFSGIVYRSSSDVGLMRKHYPDKKEINWREFVSTTSKETTVQGNAIIFRIQVYTAKDISPFYRGTANEPELLLLPNNTFFVSKPLHKEGSILYIDLCQQL